MNWPSIIKWHPTGSRYICNPPVLDTDEDYVILTESFSDFEEEADERGYTKTNGTRKREYEGVDSDFISFRRDHINLICFEDPEQYTKFLAATRVAKALNLTEKLHRVALFQAMLYGNYHDSLQSLCADGSRAPADLGDNPGEAWKATVGSPEEVAGI